SLIGVDHHRITSLPVVVLELHSRCQCRCVMCDIWKRDTARELPYELLERNRGALRAMKVQWVVLSGGEPLLHSRFFEICRLLRSEGIRITLLTAGIGLANCAQDVAYNVDDVIVSLDGPRDVHDRIRGVKRAYDLLATGVLSLLSFRPELRVTARTTVQKLNCTALCDTVRTAQELDLSGISFLAADLTSNAFNRDQPWSADRSSEIALNGDEVNALNAEIEALIGRHAREIESHYVAESPAKLRRIVRHFEAPLGRGEHVAPLCNAPWVSAVVGYDGSVRPCFFHPPLGNLHRESLEEAVNGPAALRFRGSLDVNTNATCRACVCSLHRKANAHNNVECLQTSDKTDIRV
ncbi:MAG TPA: radical SAM protein, partial [Terriglobales bacterium]